VITMCVQHVDGWCALAPGATLDPRALTDLTACGCAVIMRGGTELREPTCPECIVAMSGLREMVEPS